MNELRTMHLTKKTCPACQNEKEASCFAFNKASKDGLHGYCRQCSSVISKAWRESNKEKAKMNRAAWEERNPDKVASYRANHYAKHASSVLAKQAAYRANNPDCVRATQERYYAANKEKKSTYRRQWVEANRYRVRTYNHARRVANVGKLSADIVNRLVSQQIGKCVYCDKQLGAKYHIDHRIPLALGGTNTDENIQLLCRTCNLKKGAKHPDEFIRQQKFNQP